MRLGERMSARPSSMMVDAGRTRSALGRTAGGVRHAGRADGADAKNK